MIKKSSDALVERLKLSESYISMGLGLLVVIILGVLAFNYLNKKNQTLSLPGIQAPNEEGGKEMNINLPTTHTITQGESLWVIAERYYKSGYNWVTLAQANDLQNANYLEVGQKLTVPQAKKIEPPEQMATVQLSQSAIKEESYTVVKGDNLWQIAVRAYGDGYQWIKIAKVNYLANPDLIHAGNTLKLPR